ncbi:MAG TPA: membrane protein insertase YidC [Bacteroidota bacterium]|nr:membrane protein insertase YidC [Bacteroidota bacterium]
MDRNTVIGFILIGLILMIWMWMNMPPPSQQRNLVDSTHSDTVIADTTKRYVGVVDKNVKGQDTLGNYFSHLVKGIERNIIIESQNYRAEISTKGGNIRSWKLQNYKTWDQQPIDLLSDNKQGEFNLIFYTSDGKLVNTKNLFFQSEFQNGKIIKLQNNDSIKINLSLIIDNDSRIIKTLTFEGGTYSMDADYRFERMNGVISNFEYQATWETGLPNPEYNSVDESNFSKASVFAGGEVTEVDASDLTETLRENLTGRMAWVAIRNKYFTMAIIPRYPESNGAYLEGTRRTLPNKGIKEDYNVAVKMPFLGKDVENARFTLYLGPLDIGIVKSYNIGLDHIMSLGAAWIIRPIAEYVIIPLFQFLRYFIPNYGYVLIVFSIIIKIILHPLTRTSMRSMQRMQSLQPMMNEIREKYKDDPQKMNQQIMRLYKEYGVNPAGGCLPMLLQLPILYALWNVFSSAIELRQASFIWWITDLSVPDVIVTLPFHLPIFDINTISGLALLMGITMFIQQKMTVKDPRQKMMVWMMPILMTLLFNSFPSGLNLYYFVFNLLSIAQQAWMNKHHKNEPLRKIEVKKGAGGFMSRLTKNMPKLNK